VVATFEDGRALFEVVCQRGLEGVVRKRLRDPYRPGERLWVKTKNRTTPRFRRRVAPRDVPVAAMTARQTRSAASTACVDRARHVGGSRLLTAGRQWRFEARHPGAWTR
jgi:ATP-dependent DNA ligase